MENRDFDSQINAFLERKTAQFPDLTRITNIVLES